MAESSCEQVGSQLCAKDETIEEKNYVRTAQTRMMGYSEVLNDRVLRQSFKEIKNSTESLNRTKIGFECSLPLSQKFSNVVVGHTDSIYIITPYFIIL